MTTTALTDNGNLTVLNCNQQNASSSATQVIYGHSSNGSMPYVGFFEGAFTGILGKSYSNIGIGLRGQNTSAGYGVYGEVVGGVGGVGLYGYVAYSGTGVVGVGTFGVSGSGDTAGYFNGDSNGVMATTFANTGAYFGVYARQSGASSSGGAVYANAYSASSYAFYGATGKMYNAGDCQIVGYLTKSGGGFRIDHPTKPHTHYLNHGFVESDVMRNEYPGNVTLDANGEATVTMPEWFAHVNSEPSVTVTAKGKRMVTGWDQLDERTFKILGDAFGVVSYTISCKRSDAWTKQNCPGVEIEKNQEERHGYINPELFGQNARHIHSKMREEIANTVANAEKFMASFKRPDKAVDPVQ